MTGRIKKKQCYGVIRQSKDLERISDETVPHCPLQLKLRASWRSNLSVHVLPERITPLWLSRGSYLEQHISQFWLSRNINATMLSHNVPKGLNMYPFLEKINKSQTGLS